MRPIRGSAESVPPREKFVAGANADRFRIISNLSHELRSPLHVINGYLDILAEDWAAQLGGEPERILERLRLSTAELKQTVENLLEYAAAMTDTQAAVRETVDVADLVAEVDQAFAAAAQRKKISLVWLVEPELKLVHFERRRLLSILGNLVSNAIKFTDRGGVTVRLRRIGTKPPHEVELEVADTGIGMEAGRLEEAFLPFVQLSSSNARAYRGLGLGLALVRRNVISLGARLEVESKPFVGTSFRVRFQEAAQESAASNAGRTRESGYTRGATVGNQIQSRKHKPPRRSAPAGQGEGHRARRREAVKVYA